MSEDNPRGVASKIEWSVNDGVILGVLPFGDRVIQAACEPRRDRSPFEEALIIQTDIMFSHSVHSGHFKATPA